MLLYSRGSANDKLSDEDIKAGLFEAFDKLGKKKKVLALPPDITRLHSHSGVLTDFAYEYYGDKLTDVLPAIGTHYPMTEAEIAIMFKRFPKGSSVSTTGNRD